MEFIIKNIYSNYGLKKISKNTRKFIETLSNKKGGTFNISSESSVSNIETNNENYNIINYANNNFLVYSQKVKNIEIVTIGWKNRNILCMIVEINYTTNESHILLFDKYRKCGRNGLYPTTNEIRKMMDFIIDYSNKRKIKKITLVDQTSLLCENNGIKYSANLSDYYLLKKMNSYYGYNYGFTLQNIQDFEYFTNDIDIIKKTKIFNIDWKTIDKYIKDKKEYDKFKKFLLEQDKNILITKFFENMKNNFCEILPELIKSIFKILNLSTLRGKVFEKIL